MNSGFLDPNNHVPELTQDDAWDDAEIQPAESRQPGLTLPPRRSVTDKEPSSAEGLETGLRIGPGPSRDEFAGVPRSLEIQEITGSVIRLEQEAPASPRVDRVVAFKERPAQLKGGKNPRGEGLEWGRVHRGSPRWIIAMGAVVLVLVVSGIAALPKINAPNAPRPIPMNIAFPEVEEKPEGIDELNRLVTRLPEAIQIYCSFVQASHPDEIIPFIRDGAAMKAPLRDRWVPMRLPKSWVPSNDSTWNVMTLEGHPCGKLNGLLPDSSRFTAYFTADNGQLLLDWKATTAYGTATFAQLDSGEGDGSEIRGEISMSDFYTSSFPESGYQSFRLVSPDGNNTLWCYASRNEQTYGRIASQLQTGLITGDTPGPKKITLRLEHEADGALPNQWLISDVLHFDWVSP